MSDEIIKEYQDVIDQTALVAKIDGFGVITYTNENFCTTSGFECGELIGMNISAMQDGNYSKAVFDDLWENILSKNSWHGIVRYKSKDDGEYYLRLTVYPILDKNDNLREYICVGYEITEEVLLEKDKNKKIISTKTTFVQKTKDKETIIQKELNDIKAQLSKSIELVEYLKNQNKELIAKSDASKYESEINRLTKQNEQLRIDLKKTETSIKSMQLDFIRKEKALTEKLNNLQVKNVDLHSRNETLHNEVKKSKNEIQKLVSMMNNAKKPKERKHTTVSDLLPTYKDKEKEEVVKKSVLKALFQG